MSNQHHKSKADYQQHLERLFCLDCWSTQPHFHYQEDGKDIYTCAACGNVQEREAKESSK
jgi:hypothetical protein